MKCEKCGAETFSWMGGHHRCITLSDVIRFGHKTENITPRVLGWLKA